MSRVVHSPTAVSNTRLSPADEAGGEVRQPALPLPPPVVVDACRCYGLTDTPLAWRVRDDGTAVLIAADGRKLIYPAETP